MPAQPATSPARLSATALSWSGRSPLNRKNHFTGTARDGSIWETGAPEIALRYLEKAIELWSKAGQATYAYSYVGHLFSAAVQAAVQCGRYSEALAFETRMPTALTSSDSLYYAGVAGSALGRHEAAIDRWNRACLDAPARQYAVSDPSTASWRPLEALAQLYSQTGRHEQAYEMARRAADVEGRPPSILHALAYLCASLGKHEEGIDWARRVVAGERDEGTRASARRIIYNIGLITNRPSLIVEACSGEVKDMSEQEAMWSLAKGCSDLGDWRKQQEVLTAGCAKFPHDHEMRMVLAELLDRQGRALDAANTLAGAIDQPGVPPQLYQRLAVQLTKLGRPGDAANALKMAALSGLGK